MNILVVIPSLAGGGAERVTTHLVNGLAAMGHSVTLATGDASGPNANLLSPNVALVDLGHARMFRALWPLARLLRDQPPASMLAVLPHAGIAALAASILARRKTPVAVVLHTTASHANAQAGLKARAIEAISRRVLNRVSAVVCVSRGIAKDAIIRYRLDPLKVTTILNPAIAPNIHRLAAEPCTIKGLPPKGEDFVIAVGRLAKEKNYPLLLHAFAKATAGSATKLIVLGNGPEASQLKKLAGSLGIQQRVVFAGYTPNPYAAMVRARCLVLSSDFEGLPTVLIEALALGVPVISTDCPSGPREILDAGALGRLVPVQDAKALSEAIADCLTHPKAVKGFLPAPYTVETASKAYVALLQTIAPKVEPHGDSRSTP